MNTDNFKLQKSIIDIIATVVLPVFAGAIYIVWAINLLTNPIIVFPLISIFVLILYYISGNVYSGLFTVFAILAGLFSIIFIDDKSQSFFVIMECVYLICLYFVLEMYSDKYLSLKNMLQEEHETLERGIAMKESEINENKKRKDDIMQQIQNFQKMSRMLRTFQASLDEKEIIEKSEELAAQFIGNATWKLKKNTAKDVFAKYIKDTGLPLIITDLSNDDRFTLTQNKYLSVIAVPVEVNGNFWGILRGTSHQTNAFNDSDLRLLSILSSTVSSVLSNAYLYRRLKDLSITDGLTGLYTQSYFKERLREEMYRSRSNKIPLTVAIIDIDFFKNINDTYGHQAGDTVLNQIALLLMGRFRETDLIARYGGEEFGVIMLHTDRKEAFKVLDEVRRSIEKERFFLSVRGGSLTQVKITVSIGFADLDNTMTTFVEDELIKKADKALYKAKKSGRNRTEEFLND